MKRKLSLLLVLSLICSMILFVPANAAEYMYGYVLDKGFSNSINRDLMLLVSDNNGNETAYTCQSSIRINSELYKKSEKASEAINTGAFIRFTLSGGYINVIDFDTTPNVLTGVAYNASSGKFEGVADLPIYYVNGESVSKPNLDENFLYDIEVYDYAVNITNFVSKDSFAVIESINISSSVDYTFNQCISVTCETEEQNAILCANLYDANGKFIASEKTSTWDEVLFTNIENKTADYKIDVWLEDANGKVLSRVYNEEHTTEGVPVYRGKVLRKAISEKIDREVMVEIEDASGAKNIYYVEDRAYINKFRYKDADDAIGEIPMNTEFDFMLKNGKIWIIGFDDRVKPSFNNCKVENGTFTAEIKTENVLFDFHFMLAIYNKQGKLVKVVWETISAQEDGKNVSFAADEKYKDYTVKILTWHKTRFRSASNVVSSEVWMK